MCQNWNVQIENLMLAEQPTVDGLMTIAGVSPDVEGKTDAAYVALETALADFKPGDDVSVIQESLSLVLSETQALSTLIPPQAEAILVVVIAAVKGGIAIFDSANAPTPAAQKTILVRALAEASSTVPGFKLDHFELLQAHIDHHVAANHYKRELDKAVSASGPEYAHLKQ